VTARDSANVNASSNNDGFLNKKFYLQSYGGFRLKRLDGLLDGGFRHFLVDGKRIVGVSYRRSVSANVPTSGATFQQQARPVSYVISRYLPDRVD